MKDAMIKTVDTVEKLCFSKIKKTILEIIYTLLNIQKIKDSNIKHVFVIDTC